LLDLVAIEPERFTTAWMLNADHPHGAGEVDGFI
jgi:hypothetical protein